jgi:hypothetical protein
MDISIKKLVEAIISDENADAIFSAIWNEKIMEAVKTKKREISKSLVSKNKYREDAEWKPVQEANDVDGEWRLTREVRDGKIVMVKRRISRKVTESEEIEEGIGRGDRASALGGFSSSYKRHGKEWDEDAPKTYTKPQSEKFYHQVKFDDKHKAKQEGMKWDAAAKKWYHTSKILSDNSSFPKDEAK